MNISLGKPLEIFGSFQWKSLNFIDIIDWGISLRDFFFLYEKERGFYRNALLPEIIIFVFSPYYFQLSTQNHEYQNKIFFFFF